VAAAGGGGGRLEPFGALLQQFRHAIIDPSHVGAAEAIGGTLRLASPRRSGSSC
jgi:hypothetical protein